MGKTEVIIIGLSSLWWETTIHKYNMKAFDMLKALHSIDIRKGEDYIRTAKENGYCLDILQGKLKPKHWYFVDFHEKSILGHPDVILTMGSNEKQYFYELEK